jgi:4'-phosphopantetheinyl transferase
MGIYLKHTLSNASTIGLWEINEGVDVLYAQLILNAEEQSLFNSFNNDIRKLHWLSYRNLLKELVSPGEYAHVNYDENGKPYMTDNMHHLSVAHSGKFSAAIISKSKPVGIDIELLHPKIERVVHKFLSEKEMAFISNASKLEQWYVCWGAKEALYKLYGKKELDFRENLLLSPFNYNEKGELHAKILTAETNKNYCLYYEKIENYILVHVTKEE